MFKKKPISERIKAAVTYRDNGICQNCGKKATIITEFGAVSYPRWRAYEKIDFDKVPFEIGHIVPELYGGEAVMENLILLCRRCNRSLGANLWQPPHAKEC